jgi:hypothetical protein
MADFPGKIAGAMGDAAKSIGQGIVNEAKRVPVDIAKDTVEGLSGGAIDLDAGEKMVSEMTPEEKKQKEIRRQQEAGQIARLHQELENVVRIEQQKEAQRRQAVEQTQQQGQMMEQKKKQSLRDRVVGMFTKRASSKGEMEKGKK